MDPPGTNPIIKFVATNYQATLMIKSSVATDVCGTTTSNLITENFSRPLFSFTYCEAPPGPFEYNWYPSVFLSDSTIQQPLAYVPKSIKYWVQSVGRSACILRDSADVYIPTHNYAVFPNDTAICFGETSPMRVTGGTFTYKWMKLDEKGKYVLLNKEATCWDCATPILRPEKTTVYKIAVYDSVWCIDTLTAKITVMPLPDIRILNRDTFVKYGQSIQLLASGARMYNWSPVGSLNNANISYPVATPTEPTMYIAAGIGKWLPRLRYAESGCRLQG